MDKGLPTRAYWQGPTFRDWLQRFHRPIVHRLWGWLTFPWTSLLPGCRLGLLHCFVTLTLTLLRGALWSNKTARPCWQRLAFLCLPAGIRRKASQLSRGFLAHDLAWPWLLASRSRDLRICCSTGSVWPLPSCTNAACYRCGGCHIGDGCQGQRRRCCGGGHPRCTLGRLCEKVSVWLSAWVVGRLVAMATL